LFSDYFFENYLINKKKLNLNYNKNNLYKKNINLFQIKKKNFFNIFISTYIENFKQKNIKISLYKIKDFNFKFTQYFKKIKKSYNFFEFISDFMIFLNFNNFLKFKTQNNKKFFFLNSFSLKNKLLNFYSVMNTEEENINKLDLNFFHVLNILNINKIMINNNY
jgi:hypothetical protein